MRFLIIGSGLSSYGATLALIEKENIELDVIDIGLKKSFRNQLNNSIPNSKDLSGSFYAYGLNDNRWPVDIISKRICSSHAFGGFSKVYSGSILRPKISDLSKWPKESIPSDSDYEAIQNSLKLLNKIDELNKGFPIDPKFINESPSQWCYLGNSRIAYNKSSRKITDLPFDSSLEFEKWKKNGKIKYRKNSFVTKISSSSNCVEVEFINDQNCRTIKYDKVFIGAGCINTTALIDKSLYKEGLRKYNLKSAPLLIQLCVKLPFFKSRFLNENSYNYDPNKCRFFLEARSFLTSNKWSHTQIGDIYESIRSKFINENKFFNKLLGKFVSFFQFSITSFHSSLGKGIEIKSYVNGGNQRQFLTIEEKNNKYSFLRSIFIKFAIISKINKLGIIPIPFSSIIADIARKNLLGGWHYGGTLPMCSFPKELSNCYVSGELKGLKNVYIIDPSSFPSIPGSSIALLTMANAYRIAKNSTPQ